MNSFHGTRESPCRKASTVLKFSLSLLWMLLCSREMQYRTLDILLTIAPLWIPGFGNEWKGDWEMEERRRELEAGFLPLEILLRRPTSVTRTNFHRLYIFVFCCKDMYWHWNHERWKRGNAQEARSNRVRLYDASASWTVVRRNADVRMHTYSVAKAQGPLLNVIGALETETLWASRNVEKGEEEKVVIATVKYSR